MPSYPERLPQAALLFLLILPLLAAGRGGGFHAADPLPAHTGGFGEPTCRTCHFDGPERPASGSLDLLGLPRTLRGGQEVTLRVRLTRSGLQRGGFQLAVRSRAPEGPNGLQAGTLRAADGRVQILTGEEGSIQYAAHTPEGLLPSGPGRAAWDVLWTVPERGSAARGDTLFFHLAANAANYDDSEFGDVIYTRVVTVPY